jgi:hypothetical protein
MVDNMKVVMMDGSTTLAEVIANCNVVADKDAYNSDKLRGEIIFDVSEGKFYGNHAADGATPDWQDLGGSAGTGTDSTSFTLNQDNTGAGVNAAFVVNRGTSGSSTHKARLVWNETDERWEFGAEGMLAPVKVSKIYIGNSSNYIYADGSGNMVLHVANGKGFKFEEESV